MDRRQFLATSSATAATLLLMPTIGCTDNPIAIINTVLDSAAAVITVAEPGAPWVAQMQAAITTLKNAEASWKSGSAVTIVVSALDTLAAVAAVIPFTAIYSPLIDILVAGIDAVLAALPLSTKARLSDQHNPRAGRTALKRPHALESHVGVYKKQWNDIVDATPALAAAKL